VVRWQDCQYSKPAPHLRKRNITTTYKYQRKIERVISARDGSEAHTSTEPSDVVFAEGVDLAHTVGQIDELLLFAIGGSPFAEHAQLLT